MKPTVTIPMAAYEVQPGDVILHHIAGYATIETVDHDDEVVVLRLAGRFPATCIADPEDRLAVVVP